MNQRFSQFITALVVLAIFLRPTFVLAETPATPTAPVEATPPDNSGFEMPDPGTQPEAAKVPPQSRSSDNGAAKALAIVGAAMAMAMCAKLNADAAKAEKEGDKERAKDLKMMAMMQCAQAAKDMAEAAKNGKDKDKLEENQTPQMAKLPQQKPFKTPKAPSEKLEPSLGGNPAGAPDTKSPDPEVAKLNIPEPDLESPATTIPPSYKRPGDDFIIPDLIDRASITGNESAKGGEGGNFAGSNSPSGSFAGALKSSASSDGKMGTAPNDTPMTQVITRGIGNKGGAGGGEEGASSSSKASSENGDGGMNLNDMMAGLFGAPPGGGGPGGSMGGSNYIEYTPVPTNPSTGKRYNIFEAASQLYQRANGNKIKRAKLARNYKSHPPTQIATLSKE